MSLLKFMGSLTPLSSPLLLSHSYSEQVNESSSLSSSLELLAVVLPDPTMALVGVLFDFFLLPLPMLTRSKVLTKVEFFGVVLLPNPMGGLALLNLATFSLVKPDVLTCLLLELKWLTGLLRLLSLCSLNMDVGIGFPERSFNVRILGVL